MWGGLSTAQAQGASSTLAAASCSGGCAPLCANLEQCWPSGLAIAALKHQRARTLQLQVDHAATYRG